MCLELAYSISVKRISGENCLSMTFEDVNLKKH